MVNPCRTFFFGFVFFSYGHFRLCVMIACVELHLFMITPVTFIQFQGHSNQQCKTACYISGKGHFYSASWWSLVGWHSEIKKMLWTIHFTWETCLEQSLSRHWLHVQLWWNLDIKLLRRQAKGVNFFCYPTSALSITIIISNCYYILIQMCIGIYIYIYIL